MGLTRRELIAAGGEVAALLAVAGALPASARAGGGGSAVITATWRGLSREQFTHAYLALTDGGLSELEPAEGVMAIWSQDLQEGTLLSQWKDADSAKAAVDSGNLRAALSRAGAALPRTVDVVLVTPA